MRTEELTLDAAKEKYRKFWQLDVLTRRDGTSKCYCCDSPQVIGRASMNIWGTIVDFDVCERHAHLDGKWADSIPVESRLEGKPCDTKATSDISSSPGT